MAAISSVGLGAGFLTSDLIDKITSAERAATDLRLDRKQEQVDAKLSAYGQLQSAITEMRLPARILGQASLDNRLAAKSNNSDVEVNISGAASPGQYNLSVNHLATANTLRSTSFAAQDEAIGTGTLTISIGDKTVDLEITEENNTLEAITNAINAETDLPVNAQIIDTGSTGFQLMITSEQTGAENDITISVVDDDGDNVNTAGLSQLTEANLVEEVDATDAVLSLNGITVTRSSNTVDDLIDGLSFELVGESNNPGTVSVTPDVEGFAEDIQDFVDKYNAFKEIYQELTAYDAGTNQGGLLIGDSAIRNLDAQLRNALSDQVAGLGSANIRSFGEIGIKTDSQTGQLSFDQTEFEKVFKGNVAAVTDLFAGVKTATDPQVSIFSASSEARGGDYSVEVTALATQGSLTGAANIADPANIVIDGDNDELTIAVDGVNSGPIVLTAGTYTAESLAQELQTQINNNTALNSEGSAVTVSFDSGNGTFVINSDKYGSESKVEILTVDTNTEAQLGLSVAAGTDGSDVEGLIDGKVATGNGQILTAADDSNAKGIEVKIDGGALGSRGTVSFAQGIGDQLVDSISSFISVDGSLTVRQDGLRETLAQIQQDRDDLEDRIEAQRDLLVKQFTAADILVSQLNSTQDFLKNALNQNNNSDS